MGALSFAGSIRCVNSEGKLWDKNMANAASAIDHAMKMGAVILQPASKPKVGFSPPEPPSK